MQPKIYHTHEHKIDPALIDADALYVVKRLRDAGYEAYIVGGSVRDLLIQRTPKDFDISTSALPEEIKKVFQRQCLIIGRRFRLAHIRFGHKILEVSTFRSGDNESDLITQDNVWGTPIEDVMRRDFTINGLFYDPSNHSIIDYVDGLEDVKKRVLRTIGDPYIRFKQDPVRMLRLLKFRARTGFEIHSSCRQALVDCRGEISKSSPARVLEEILRMLESGAAAPFFMLMMESGVLELLLPPLSHFLVGTHGHEVFKFLKIADKINQTNLKHPIDRALLVSCLLFPILEAEIRNHFTAHKVIPHIGEVMELTSTLIRAVLNASFSHFPKRITTIAAFILTTQYRLTPPSGKRHPRPKLIRMREFDLALKFLKMRALVDGQWMEAYEFWKELYRQHEAHGDHRIHRHHPGPPTKTRSGQRHGPH